jgi:hypothetical protein
MALHKPPIPVGFARVAAEGIYDGTTWANVYYFQVVTYDNDHLQDVAQLLHDSLHALYNTVLSSHLMEGWHLHRERISFRDSEDSVYRFNIADAVNGGHSGVEQDAQVAYLINWQSGDPRKGGKPRQYICGVPSASMIDAAHIDSSLVASVSAALASWIDDNTTRTSGTASGLVLVEMSFRNANTFRDAAAAFAIAGGTLDGTVATQRRRVDRVR